MDNRTQLNSYVTDRLINATGSAEGALLPPRQQGAGRIPVVSGLKVAQVSNYLGGTQFTLVWQEPTTSVKVATYNIYVVGALSNNQEPLLLNSVKSSPAQVRVVGSAAAVLTFYVQTVLTSGNVSTLTSSPSCTAQLAAPTINSASSIAVGAINPGSANQLIGTNPTATANEFKSLSGATNQITTTFGAGSIALGLSTQCVLNALALGTVSQGAGSLTIGNTTTTVFADATSGNVTLTTPASPKAGQFLIVKRVDSSANTVTIAANTGQTVEAITLGANNSVIYQYDSNATKWRIIGKF